VHARQEASETGRFVEVSIAPASVPMWGRPVAARAGHFLLSDEARSGKRASRTFPITTEDLELVRGNRLGFILETADRRDVLDGFVAELSARGLESAGKGEAWYSYRFRRPAR
jgi:hypothetical protein